MRSAADVTPAAASTAQIAQRQGNFVAGWVEPDGDSEKLVPHQVRSPCD